MKRIPLWRKYYIFYIIGMLVIITILTSAILIETHADKKDIISTDSKNIAYFAETELGNRFKNVEERFGGIEIARSFQTAEQQIVVNNYKYTVQSLLETLCADNREVLSVFYVDTRGNNYSAGESIGGLSKRLSLIEDARKKESEYKKKNIWFYGKTDKGDHACVLYRDIVFVSDAFEKQVLGSMLVYVDAEDIYRDYLSGVQEGTGIMFVDADDTIIISTDSSAIGEKYNTHFRKTGDRISDNNGNSYVYNESNSIITGWKTVGYFSAKVIADQTKDALATWLILTFFCVALMTVLSYFVTRRLGKPIADLARAITVNDEGSVEISDEISRNEAQIIKTVFDDMSEKLMEQTELNHQKELQFQTALLKSYEYQMNPHFLFNTLQIIQMLSVMDRNEDVNEAVTCLGNMLRFNLRAENEVMLSEEIENIENYFKILKYRFANNFVYKILIDEKLYSCKVLKFLLQPFVENAVKHGLQDSNEKWEIVIAAEEINDELAIVIKDNGLGISKEKLLAIKKSLTGDGEITGVGIKNVDSRIKLTYGDGYGVDIFSNSGTQVIIHIPSFRER